MLRKVTEWMTKYLRWIVMAAIVLAFVVVISFSIRRCSPNNPHIPVVAEDQKTEVLNINDSIKILRQLLYISETHNLSSDSLLREAIRKGNIQVETVASWRSVYAGDQRNIKLEDSLSIKVAQLLASQQSLLLSSDLDKKALQAKYDNDKKVLLSSRIVFRDSSRYREIAGDLGFDSDLHITKDVVISEPFVAFGEKKKFLGLGRTEYSVLIGDKNPAITQSKAYSAKYIPKLKPQLSLGPVIMANKTNIAVGAGVTFKKGIFSITAGYLIK